MNIKNTNQFNHSVDQHKLLSSTSGVGSLIATKFGTFIMPLSIKNWKFISRCEKFITEKRNRQEEVKSSDLEFKAVSVIDDSRFVQYLSQTEGYPNLKHLIALPHMQLDEKNRQKVDKNPLYQRFWNDKDANQCTEDFSVPAIVFPRWLYSEKSHRLLPLSEWKKEWARIGEKEYNFVPPRDADDKRTYKKRSGEENTDYGILKQMPLVLICPQGHISDIPWELYFSAALEHGGRVPEDGFDFEKYKNDPNRKRCPKSIDGHHELTYTESSNKASGWGVLKCKKCNAVVSLEGIMNLRPKCTREMPWHGIDQGVIATDRNKCKDPATGKDSTMRVALLTSSGIYYGDQVSSLYISKQNDTSRLTEHQQKLLEWWEKQDLGDKTREEFWEANEQFLLSIASFTFPGTPTTQEDFDAVKPAYLSAKCETYNPEQYRYEEYETFVQNESIDSPKLKFSDIDLPEDIQAYFKKISRVDTLCITKTQMNFFRCTIPTVKLSGGSIVYPKGMRLTEGDPADTNVYPANQEFGEGIFFQFNEEKLAEFSKRLGEKYPSRYHKRDYKMCSQLSSQLDKYGKAEHFYLLHTFAHCLIKELEFSCGYPSASLKERIYFSDRMCGFLVYTADGAEGGMGGLSWQAQPGLIENIIHKLLERTSICSSDPICWEQSEDTMNYAACFSCCMISETSCEYRNYGLDRRALVDEDFGYFTFKTEE